MTRREYAGRIASRGVAFGTLRRDRGARPAHTRTAESVIGAIAATLSQLYALQARSDDLGSEILQFQIEMLEDDVFVTEILERSAATGNPARAVAEILDEQIEVFASDESETFSTRSADLTDLRDRLIACFAGQGPNAAGLPEGTILLVDDLTPSRFLELDWNRLGGIAALGGSTASHVALLARSQGVPMLVDIGELDTAGEGQKALLDATAGQLIIQPDPGEAEAIAAEPVLPAEVAEGQALGPAMTPEGELVRANLTVNSLDALDEFPAEWFDGIGLVRTELLFPGKDALLRTDTQADIYRRLFDWAGSKPVTLRLFDAGGDKVMPGFALAQESNAFLGIRGARLLARRPDVLRTQIAAVLLAAADRPVRIMVPMLTLPGEMGMFRETLRKVAAETGSSIKGVMLGMMVETPAAALEVSEFDADFFAIGTNDLTQYTLAASRDSDALDTGSTLPAAVLELVRRVVDYGAASGKDVSLCGDAATSPAQLRQILDCGIRSVSIPGRFAPRFKQFIRGGE